MLNTTLVHICERALLRQLRVCMHAGTSLAAAFLHLNIVELPCALQKIATREEVENYATEAMVKEYIDKRRSELEDLIKFNMAVDEIFDKEQLPLEEEDIQSEVDIRKKSYQVSGCLGGV